MQWVSRPSHNGNNTRMVETQVNLKHYDYLLETIRLRVQGDLFFVSWVSSPDDTPPVLVASYPHHAGSPPTALIGHLATVTTQHEDTVPLHAGTQGITPFTGGVVHCVRVSTGTLITGVLTYGDPAYVDADQRAVAQAGALAAELWGTAPPHTQHQKQQNLLDASRVLPHAPHPQALVEAIQHYFLGEKVSVCALLLYGPNNSPANTSEYVEVAGTWGRAFGAGYGLGTRVYFNSDVHLDLLEALQRDTALFSSDARVATFAQQDALFRGLLKAKMVEDWALYALHTPQERVGVLLLATDNPNGFTAQEQHYHHELAEIITIAVALQTFRRELSASKYGRAALLDAVNDGVLIASPGINGATVTMMNERFREMFNCHNLFGMLKLDSVLDQMEIPPSIRQQLATAWKSVPLRNQQTLRGTFDMVTHQGQPAEISWYSAPMYNPEGDDVFARVYIFHDTMPEQAAVQVRTAFLQRVSHELRTPLTAISGFSQFILEAADDDELPPIAREYTEIINESAQHLRDVFTDLIDITRAYSGELKLNIYPTDIGRVARSVVHQHRADLRLAGQTATVEMEGKPLAHAAPDRIGQVLRQLLTNAINYAPRDAQISIHITAVNTYSTLPPCAPPDIMLPGVLVQVVDTGPGIPEKDAKAVFEPFHRGKAAHVRQVSGTGLGLTLAQSLIDLHRGKIWVEPTTDDQPGGRVCFVLPLSR